MKNVFAIFRMDFSHLTSNVIAAIVAMGLIIVPPMYAWLTTLGFWDPYDHTGNIKVAVADLDEGYRSDLIPTTVNAGAQIEAALRANDQFHWEFMGESEAIDSVESGASYAAIVIPADFSKKLLNAFSGNATQATIEYYSNQKENAIAPHVTDQGVSELQAQIDNSFTKTVAEISLATTKDLANFLSGEGVANYGAQLLGRLDNSYEELEAARTSLEGFSDLVALSQELVDSSREILARSGSLSQTASTLTSQTEQALSDGGAALSGITDTVNSALHQASSSYDAIQSAVDSAYDSLAGYPAQAKELLANMSQDLDTMLGVYRDLRTTLEGLNAPAAAMDALDAAIADGERLKTALSDASGSVATVASDSAAEKAKVQKALDQAKSAIGSVSTTLEQSLRNQTEALAADLSNLRESTNNLASSLKDSVDSVDGAAGSLSTSLGTVHDSLAHSEDTIAQAQESLAATRDSLAAALESGDLEKVRSIIGNNPAAIAGFLSAPTQLERHAVFAIANNGSSMNSFYSSLALWIGAIFLVALTSVNLSPEAVRRLKNPKPWQLYLGRYGIFALLALGQGLVLCIGNVFFVGVQCEHFWWYLLTCCICALVFSNLVYTLTISFGNVGKAIAIIALVMQLAGTGGIMPVQMSAPFFQALYPWLPFAHSIEAMASCVAGIYGNQLAQSLGILLAFLVPSLALGLVFRRPIIRVNDFITKKLDATKLV